MWNYLLACHLWRNFVDQQWSKLLSPSFRCLIVQYQLSRKLSSCLSPVLIICVIFNIILTSILNPNPWDHHDHYPDPGPDSDPDPNHELILTLILIIIMILIFITRFASWILTLLFWIRIPRSFASENRWFTLSESFAKTWKEYFWVIIIVIWHRHHNNSNIHIAIIKPGDYESLPCHKSSLLHIQGPPPLLLWCRESPG